MRESKTTLDSGFHAVDAPFQVLDSNPCQGNLDSGFQCFSGISDFLSFILDSKAQDSGFHKQNIFGIQMAPPAQQKISRFRNPDSLICGERREALVPGVELLYESVGDARRKF